MEVDVDAPHDVTAVPSGFSSGALLRMRLHAERLPEPRRKLTVATGSLRLRLPAVAMATRRLNDVSV